MASTLDIIIRAIDQASGPARGIVSAIGGIATAATAAGMAVAAATVAIGVGSVKLAADFEQSLANTAAATGATKDQMAALRKEALGIGKDTSKSASEAAEAMGELVKAGVPLEKAIGGAARAVVQLAEATGSDVSAMAILVSNSMNTFKKDGLAAADIANIVAKAANASAIGTGDIAMALAAVGPVAAQAGLKMSDFATAVGILGNNALKGSDAGTSLKTMLMRLTAPTDGAKTILDGLNVSVFDAAGKTRGFRDILGDLQKSLVGATEEQKAATLSTLFGSDAIRAANILLGEGVEGWDAFGKSMSDAPSVAEQSAIRLNTFNGAMDMLKGTIETIGIEIGTLFLPALTGIAKAAGDGLGYLLGADWSLLSKAFATISMNAGMMFSALAPIFGGAGNALGPAIVNTVSSAAEALARFSTMIRETFLETTVPIIQKTVEIVQKILSGKGVDAFTEFLGPVEYGIGAKLAKIATDIGNWLGGQLTVVIDQLGRWGKAFLEWVEPFIAPLMRQLAIFAEKMLGWFYETVLPELIKQLGVWGQAFINWIGPRIPGIMFELGKLWITFVGWMISRIPEINNYLGKWGIEFLAWVGDSVVPALPGTLKGILDAVISFVNGALEPVRQAGARFGAALGQGIVNGIRSIRIPVPTVSVSMSKGAMGIDVPSVNIGSNVVSLASLIPAMAEGGIVNKPTLALIGEAGPEAVVPLGKGGGFGGVTVIIQGPIYGMADFENKVTQAVVNAQRLGRLNGLVAQT